ncbi:MAG: TrbI/VirB10 family protein [Elusimicrobia bacterium]|nr:TrbI/VirB10 family protein [Elusimicrobiota bacterium]
MKAAAAALLVFLPLRCLAGSALLDPSVFDSTLAKSAAPEAWQGITVKPKRETRYFLPTGFTFPARLENAVYSYNVETPAMAAVERDVEYLGKIVIPAGTRMIGTVSVQQSHDRILITFHTMVFPEGDEVKYLGMGLSLDGSAGIKGKVETHKDSAVANTVLKSVLGGTQQALVMSGISPIAAGATQGLVGEANATLETQRQQVNTSISVEAETGLRVYLPQRLEY